MGQVPKGKHLFPCYQAAKSQVCMEEWLLLKASSPMAVYPVFSDPYLSFCASRTFSKFCS